VRRTERVEESLHPEDVRVRERARVAHVPADRLRPVAVAHPAQPRADVRQGVVPRHALELAIRTAPERVRHAVGVVLHVGHRDPLGARVAARQRMVGVRPQLRHATVLDRGDHPTVGLADTTERDDRLRAHVDAEPTPLRALPV
jgi:hypothetical protein